MITGSVNEVRNFVVDTGTRKQVDINSGLYKTDPSAHIIIRSMPALTEEKKEASTQGEREGATASQQ